MDLNKCDACFELNELFEISNKEENLSSRIRKSEEAYEIMKKLKENSVLDFYMSDTKFDKWKDEICEEKRSDYNLYMQCKKCKKVYRLGVCVRGRPLFKIFDTPPDKQEFKERCKEYKYPWYV